MDYVKISRQLRSDEKVKEIVFQEYLAGKSFETIGKEYGWSPSTVTRIYKENGGKARTDREQALKYTCNEHYFDEIDTAEKAYWLGFMYTDGFIQAKRKYSTIKVGITITASDIHHLEKFKEAVEFTGPIHTYTPEKKEYSFSGTKPYCRILISSEGLAQGLINHGCITQKSDKLVYPGHDIVPEEFERDFVRGCIDGDGSIIFYSPEREGLRAPKGLSYTGTKSMCQGILHFLGKDEITLHQRYKDRDVDNYQFNIGGNYQVLRMLNLLYKDATVYLDRKYERYLKVIEESRTWK